MRTKARIIAVKYSGFINADEALDWIIYTKQELDKIPLLEDNSKRLTNYLIECTELSKFLRKHKDGIKITLKAKKDTVTLTDRYFIHLLKKASLNPFTGKGHKHPKRKQGGQFGKVDLYTRQRIAHDLYVLYQRRLGKVHGVNEFIRLIFEAAGYDVSYNTIRSKIIDKKNWPKGQPIIFREIDNSHK